MLYLLKGDYKSKGPGTAVLNLNNPPSAELLSSDLPKEHGMWWLLAFAAYAQELMGWGISAKQCIPGGGHRDETLLVRAGQNLL